MTDLEKLNKHIWSARMEFLARYRHLWDHARRFAGNGISHPGIYCPCGSCRFRRATGIKL